MKIFKNFIDLKIELDNAKNLGFVPTMGGLHKGHISLIKLSKKKCKFTLVSIFVNPSQFNKKNDYKRYPRSLGNDISRLRRHKVDYLYFEIAAFIISTRPLRLLNSFPQFHFLFLWYSCCCRYKHSSL